MDALTEAMTECGCISRLNKRLVEHNAIVMTNLIGRPRTVVTLDKLDTKKRGRLPILQASYCPFCGQEYGS